MTARARFASPGRPQDLIGRSARKRTELGYWSRPSPARDRVLRAQPGPRDQREHRAEITRRLQPGCEPSHRCRGSGGITLRMTAATALGLGFFASFCRDAIIGTIAFAGGNRATTAVVRTQAGNVVFRGVVFRGYDRFFLHLKLPCVCSRTLAGRLDADSMLHRAASLEYKAFSDSCVRRRQHSRRRAAYATRSRKLATPADLAQCTQQ